MTYVHDGDGLLARSAEVLDHVLDEHGALSDLALCEEVSIVRLQDGSEWESAHTGDDLDVVARDELDGLLSLGRHGVGGCVSWFGGFGVVGSWKCWSVEERGGCGCGSGWWWMLVGEWW